MIRDLKTEIWVDALIMRAQIGGASGFIIHKGDRDAGSVIIKIACFNKIPKTLIPSRDIKGDLIFVDISKTILKGEEIPKLAEFQTDEYINKRIKQDCDLWAIEIEDVQMRDFLIERVE